MLRSFHANKALQNWLLRALKPSKRKKAATSRGQMLPHTSKQPRSGRKAVMAAFHPAPVIDLQPVPPWQPLLLQPSAPLVPVLGPIA